MHICICVCVCVYIENLLRNCKTKSASAAVPNFNHESWLLRLATYSNLEARFLMLSGGQALCDFVKVWEASRVFVKGPLPMNESLPSLWVDEHSYDSHLLMTSIMKHYVLDDTKVYNFPNLKTPRGLGTSFSSPLITTSATKDSTHHILKDHILASITAWTGITPRKWIEYLNWLKNFNCKINLPVNWVLIVGTS